MGSEVAVRRGVRKDDRDAGQQEAEDLVRQRDPPVRRAARLTAQADVVARAVALDLILRDEVQEGHALGHARTGGQLEERVAIGIRDPAAQDEAGSAAGKAAGLDRSLEAPVGADRLREPVQRRARLVAAASGSRIGRVGQRKNVEHRRRPRHAVGPRIGVGHQRSGGGHALSCRQIRTLDGADDGDVARLMRARQRIARVEILGVEGQARAIPARGPGGGRQGRYVMGAVEVRPYRERCALEIRNDRRVRQFSDARRAEAALPALQRRPAHERLPQIGELRRTMRAERDGGAERPARPFGNPAVLGLGPRRVAAADHDDVVAGLVQGVGLLDHARVGEEVAGRDDADPHAAPLPCRSSICR